jgi:hypothetical protein
MEIQTLKLPNPQTVPMKIPQNIFIGITVYKPGSVFD